MSYVVFAPDNAGIRVAKRVVRQLLRFARAAHRGVQRGEAPLLYFSPPKNGGSKGVEPRVYAREQAGQVLDLTLTLMVQQNAAVGLRLPAHHGQALLCVGRAEGHGSKVQTMKDEV